MTRWLAFERFRNVRECRSNDTRQWHTRQYHRSLLFRIHHYHGTGQSVVNATLVINNGKIVSVAKNGKVPAGAKVIDGTGYHIYQASSMLTPIMVLSRRLNQIGLKHPFTTTTVKVAAPNDAIHAQRHWYATFENTPDAAKKWIANGFTSVQTARLDGILQGYEPPFR